jgi:hypothetical protein
MRTGRVSPFLGTCIVVGSASLVIAGFKGALGRPGPASAGASDTTLIYFHQVPASKRADYERWQSEVWRPALRNAAQKSAVQRQWASTERDFQPTEKTDDSTYTYVYIFEHYHNVATPADSNGRYPIQTLLVAGYLPAQAEEQAQKLRAMIRVGRGYRLVERLF